MLDVIRKKIEHCEYIINTDCQTPVFKSKLENSKMTQEQLAQEYEQWEIRSAHFKKNMPSMIMQKNQAKIDLEKLEKEYVELLLQKTKLYLVIDRNNTVEELVKDKKCILMHHTDMALKIANFLMPAVRVGDHFNANLMAVLNDILDNVEEEIGVISSSTPKIELRRDCIHTIQDLKSLTDSIEYMIESQLYPINEIPEGHFLQALFNKVNYIKQAKETPDESYLNCVVVVPALSKYLIDEYQKFFMCNAFLIDTQDENSLNVMMSNLSDAKIEEESQQGIEPKRKYRKRNVE